MISKNEYLRSDLPDLHVADLEFFAIGRLSQLVDGGDASAVTVYLVSREIGTGVGCLETVGISDGQIVNCVTRGEEDPLP